MRKNLSRREAIVALSAGSAALVGAEPFEAPIANQKATIHLLPEPVSGNNPIVVSPDNAYPTLQKSLTVDAHNVGDAPGTFRLRLARYDANGNIIYNNLYGFGINSTVSGDFTLSAGASVIVAFYFGSSTSFFKDYACLVLMQERTAPNTYVTRTSDSTLIHYVGEAINSK